MAIPEEILELEDTLKGIVDSDASPIRFTLKVEPVAKQTWWKAHWGTVAQWVSALCAILIAAIAIVSFVESHIDKRFAPIDKHLSEIDQKFAKIDTKFDSASAQLTGLTDRVAKVEGQMDILRNRQVAQEKMQKQLGDHLAQQDAVNRLQDPNRILGTIRAEIKIAENRQGIIPASQLSDYKEALHALPTSAREYWTTVSEIINYQSLLSQLPDHA
jgi:septal ring factor EnvC (AmiA/AmiB activator)